VGLAIAAGVACATPAERADREASALGYRREVVRGVGFDHVVYWGKGPGPAPRELLHVYLDGDAAPNRAARHFPADPTPAPPLMLRWMEKDPGPSVYLGRPCAHGLGPCAPEAWTLGRYGEPVLASLAAALERLRVEAGRPGLALIGHSGGGTLAMLLAERVPEVTALVTVSANLDVAAWTEHHGYVPLEHSLDPARRPPLRGSILQIHLAGGRDRRVPPRLVRPVVARQPGARWWIFPDYDHTCCWGEAWPEILKALESGLRLRTGSAPRR
jgi:hypothetical protein